VTRREKPATSQWLIEQRKRRGWKPEDVAARLDAAVTTVRGWESGRSIGGDSLIRLEAIFGSSAPSDAPSGDQSDLAAAIRENTAMLERVLIALTTRLAAEPDEIQVQRVLKALAEGQVTEAEADPGKRWSRTNPSHQTPGPDDPGAGRRRKRQPDGLPG
jgi:transcriptional regulator with XRE-family HTH domain